MAVAVAATRDIEIGSNSLRGRSLLSLCFHDSLRSLSRGGRGNVSIRMTFPIASWPTVRRDQRQGADQCQEADPQLAVRCGGS
jgi:hypothetical protein